MIKPFFTKLTWENIRRIVWSKGTSSRILPILTKKSDGSDETPSPQTQIQETESLSNEVIPSLQQEDPGAPVADIVEHLPDDTYAVIPSQDIICIMPVSNQEQPVTYGILSFQEF